MRGLVAGGVIVVAIAVLWTQRDNGDASHPAGPDVSEPARSEDAPAAEARRTARPRAPHGPGVRGPRGPHRPAKAALRPASDASEKQRTYREELLSQLDQFRSEASLSDEQWSRLLADLFELAIEDQRLFEAVGKDALGQVMTQDDYLAAFEALGDDLESRVAEYMTARQLSVFRFRLIPLALISAVRTTEALHDPDRPHLRFRALSPFDESLTGPAGL